jgi:hypothetical protein
MTNSKLVLGSGLATVKLVLAIKAIVELLGQFAVLQ